MFLPLARCLEVCRWAFRPSVWLLTASVCLSPMLRASSPLSWRWSNPLPHGNNIADMAYGDGFAIQVGDRGQIYTSEDLDLWIPRDAHTHKALRSVAVFGKRLIAVGEAGTIVYADDLTDFKVIDLSTTNWLEAVAASPNVLVAVGDNGAIYSSSDGAIWNKRVVSFSRWLRGVAFGAGRFIAVGEGGFIASSTNGAVWQTEVSGTTTDLNHAAWITDRFWITADGGKSFTNTLSNAWRSVNSGATNTLYKATGLDGLTLLAGDNELRVRDPGSGTWFNQFRAAIPAPPWTYYTAVSQGNSVLVGGRTGVLIEGLHTNGSAIVWQGPAPSARHWLWSVWRAPDFYVAVGDRATVLTSPNGYEWDVEFVPTALTNSIFLGVGGNSNLLVAVGNQGSLMISRNVRTNVVSTNAAGILITNSAGLFGVAWEEIAPPAQNDLQGVGASQDLIVISGGKGKIFSSSNGTTWDRQSTTTTNFLSGVAWFPEGWVAVGDLGTVLSSPDAVNWTRRPIGSTQWIYQVRYLNGLLIAVGQNGTILTSSNGIQWTARNSGTGEWLNDVAFVGTNYFVAGTRGTVLTSADATNWFSLGTITLKSLYGLAAANGQLISVGIEGIILRSQVVPVLTPVNVQSYNRSAAESGTGTNYNVFLFTGKTDQKFMIERSSDLSGTDWMPGAALELLDSTGTLIHVEAETTEKPQEFFRTRLIPDP